MRTYGTKDDGKCRFKNESDDDDDADTEVFDLLHN